MANLSGIGRVSFPSVFTPSDNNGQKNYEITLLFKKDDPFIAKLRTEIAAAIKEKWKDKAPSNLKSPVRDGDEVYSDNDSRPEYQGCFAVKFRCNDKRRPGVIDALKNEIVDPGEIYPGCYARVSYTIYAYVHEESKAKGVRLTLSNVQKVKDCKDEERFDGRSSAESDFDALPQEEDTAPAGGKHLF